MSDYICKMCQAPQKGQPALRNATGCYCKSCRDVITERMIEGSRRAAESRRGVCPWCGDVITEKNRQAGREKESENVCAPCVRHRVWMLKSIRYSDRLADYVSKTEQREAPIREARAKAIAQSPPVKQSPTSADDRIARLESMIEKLTAALGGAP